MNTAHEMASRSISVLLLLACLTHMPVTIGTERVGDATAAYEFERLAYGVAAVESDCRAFVDSTADEERFNLYWNCNQLTGAWLQVEFLQTLLERAIAATSLPDEEEIRTTLRDHARYALWELDHAIAELESNLPDARRLNQWWINESIRALLSNARLTVDRLVTDHCAVTACAVAP